MYPFVLFVLYIAASLLIGALAAVPLHWMLVPLADVELHDVVPRAGMLVALLAAPWFLQRLQLVNKSALGYALPRRAFLGRLLIGALAGIAMLLPLAAALTGLEVRIPEPEGAPPWPQTLLVLLESLIAGLLIGFIEETFFRGALYSGIQRYSGAAVAVILSALLYAALHFIDPQPLPHGEAVRWYTGLTTLAGAFHPFAAPAAIADSLLALFLAGALLALIRQRSGHIALCIGVHAGWVLVIQLTKHATDRNPAAELAFLTGSYDHIIGWLAAAWLALLMVLYGRLGCRQAA